MRRILMIVGGFILLGLVTEVILVGFTYYKASSQLRTHIPEDDERPEDYGLTYENVTLGESERSIAGWIFPIDKPKGGIVLVHGLGWPKGGKAQMLVHADYLAKNGWESVAIDLSGFGDSPGNKTMLGSEEWQDAAAAFDYLKQRPELHQRPIGFLGVSMGAATVLVTAGKEQIGDFVVASVPYATIDGLLQQEISHNGYPRNIFSLPMRISGKLLIPHPVDAVDYIGQIQAPILILAGMQDDTVPEGDAEKLVTASENKVQLLSFDAGHDIYAEKPEAFREAVLSFLATVAAKN